MLRGHAYYQETFFTQAGAPKYFDRRTFPIDIHACAQAILHFTDFAALDPANLGRAQTRYFNGRCTTWQPPTVPSTTSAIDCGSIAHPYMRWGQAWMFHALARLLISHISSPKTRQGNEVKSNGVGFALRPRPMRRGGGEHGAPVVILWVAHISPRFCMEMWERQLFASGRGYHSPLQPRCASGSTWITRPTLTSSLPSSGDSKRPAMT